MKRVRERVESKGNYVVFGGRPRAVKGLAEALIVFKQILKSSSELKLVVTGRLTKTMSMILGKMCRKLGLADKVVFTGFIPRAERFEVIAKAREMLYPSHEDAFSYAVLESLHLGTPVVGYKIPALEINYGELPGVVLVDERDLEALAVKTMEILEKRLDAVEPPKVKPWEEIMSEEVGLIHKLLEIAP
jgi:glycosyltransferase involved in cell wall biosynthesis